MDPDALVITETWLTGYFSERRVGEMIPAGYLFHHAARIHKKDSWFFPVILWSVKPICTFRLSLLKITNWLCIWGDKCSCSYYLPITLKKWPESCWFLQGIFEIWWLSCYHLLIYIWIYMQLTDILRSANLRQHVQERTHRHGHILDHLQVMLTVWSRMCLCLPCCLIMSLLTSMYLYKNNLFQLKLFHTENINRLTGRLLLLICESLLWCWINRMLWKIKASKGNQRTVFNVANKVLHKSQTILPNIINSDTDMAHCFNNFFSQKILSIQGTYHSSTLSQGMPVLEESCMSMMDTFEPFTETDMKQFAKNVI